MRARLVAALLAASIVAIGHSAYADDFPNNKIRIVVPTGPGGVADTLSRIVAAKAQDTIGQSIYIENKPGANGNLGAATVLASPADAYTIMMGHIGLMTVNYHIYGKMEFNPMEAFVPVAHVVSYPDVLIVNNKLPVKTYAEFIKYAKESKSGLTYSSSGFGSSFHMAMELLTAKAGFTAVHVPYTGTAQALTALIAGDVDVTFSDVITAGPQIEAKSVRVLAVSGSHRSKSLPDVPTIIESGLPGFVVEGWSGLVAKAGTPPERVKLLNDHVNRALSAPDVVERVAKMGGEVVGGTPEAFGKFMRDEDKKWGDLAKSANIRESEK